MAGPTVSLWESQRGLTCNPLYQLHPGFTSLGHISAEAERASVRTYHYLCGDFLHVVRFKLATRASCLLGAIRELSGMIRGLVAPFILLMGAVLSTGDPLLDVGMVCAPHYPDGPVTETT